MMVKYEPVCMEFSLGSHNLIKNNDPYAEETITMIIHVKDKRAGIPPCEIYTVQTFKTSAHEFNTNNAEDIIQGWLKQMEVVPEFCPNAVDYILRCSSYQVPMGWSLNLSVFLEYSDFSGPYDECHRKEQPLLMKCPIRVSYSDNIEECQKIIVNIYCQDTREGVKSEMFSVFEEGCDVMFPVYGGKKPLEKVHEWLELMGVDPCCYWYAIDTILNFARSSYKVSYGRSLELDVNLKISGAKGGCPVDEAAEEECYCVSQDKEAKAEAEEEFDRVWELMSTLKQFHRV